MNRGPVLGRESEQPGVERRDVHRGPVHQQAALGFAGRARGIDDAVAITGVGQRAIDPPGCTPPGQVVTDGTAPVRRDAGALGGSAHAGGELVAGQHECGFRVPQDVCPLC